MGYQWISDKGSTVGFAGTCTGHHACYPNMGLPVDVPSIIYIYIELYSILHWGCSNHVDTAKNHGWHCLISGCFWENDGKKWAKPFGSFEDGSKSLWKSLVNGFSPPNYGSSMYFIGNLIHPQKAKNMESIGFILILPDGFPRPFFRGFWPNILQVVLWDYIPNSWVM